MSSGPALVTVLGRPLRCPVCAFELWSTRPARIVAGSRGPAQSPRALVLGCTSCGHLLWFDNEPGRVGAVELWDPEGGYPAAPPDLDDGTG